MTADRPALNTGDRPIDSLRRAKVVVCSACLLGCACRYDGADKRSSRLSRLIANKSVVPICPEVAGGLGVPRPPADLSGGDGRLVLAGRARVLTHQGRDVTRAFRRGAGLALRAARRYGATVAVLKDGSPSCGVHHVIIDGVPTQGQGVAAAALRDAGLALVSDDELAGRTQRGARRP